MAQQFKDWAFTLITSILYYQDYHLLDQDTRELYQKAMAAFGGIAPSYHIELLDKPTIYWDFHSLLLGIQMMFSFMLVDNEQPLRVCKHCQKVFWASRITWIFAVPGARNNPTPVKTGKKGTDAAAAGVIYLCFADSKRLAAVLLGTNCQPFFVTYAAPTEAPCAPEKRGEIVPLSCRPASQRYNTLDFGSKVVCHEPLRGFFGFFRLNG